MLHFLKWFYIDFIIFAGNLNKIAKHILYLPSWYPDEVNPLNGIFCKDLAEGLAEEIQLTVVHIYFSDIRKIYRNERKTGHFREILISLPKKKGLWGFIKNQFQYYKCLFSEVQKLRKGKTPPSMVHAQVTWKCGFDAFILKMFFGLKYIITEHNTAFLPEDNLLTGWKKLLSKIVLKRASGITAVSAKLANCVSAFCGKRVEVIPNIIHPVFTTADIHLNKRQFDFLHISNFRESHKQTDKIIDVFSELAKKYPQITLLLNVPADKYDAYKAAHPEKAWYNIHLAERVSDRKKLLLQIQSASCVVSYSRFETFGLTIAESVCAGIPVICGNCGGADLLIDGKMGKVCDSGDLNSLRQAMEEMVNSDQYPAEVVAAQGRTAFHSNKVVPFYLAMYKRIAG